MEPIDLLAIIFFCFKLDILIDLPAGMYLQCRHASYEMTLIKSRDEFLAFIIEHEQSLSDNLDAQVQFYINSMPD
jgi:hypothetical protein